MAQDKKKRKQDAIDDGFHNVASKADGAPRKKHRTYTQENAAFAKIYDNLAHELGNVRLDATKLLLTNLSIDPAPNPELFAKILKRLIRGLCSSRKAARSGFFVALTECLRLGTLRLLEDSDGNGVGFLVQRYVEEGTTVEGKASAQEKRDHAIGRVLAYQAMIESKLVFETQGSEVLWKALLQKMFSQAKSTSWLREEYCSVINNAIAELTKNEYLTNFINEILSNMVEQKLENTPEGVALWLTALADGSNVSFPKNCWRKEDPLDKHERARLIRIMKGGLVDEPQDTSGAQKTGGNQIRLNFAWNALISNYLNRLGPAPAQKTVKIEKKFTAFWKEMVDDILFAESASPERKSLGLQLLASTITSCPAWAIPSLFSSNVIRCIVNQRADTERLLHEAAKAPLDRIKTRTRTQPKIACLMVETLISSSRLINFDHLTKTKTIGDIINGMNAQSLSDILNLIESMISNPGRYNLEATESDVVARTFANMLLTLTRGRNVDMEEAWMGHMLRILLELSYFDGPLSSQIAAASRDTFRSRLMSCINHMISSESEASKACYTLISNLKTMREAPEFAAVLKADGSIQRSLKHAIRTVADIDHNRRSGEARGAQLPILNAFACLYALTILQVYNEEPDAVAMLDEIDSAYQAAVDGKGSLKEPFDLLVEVLLGMVSKQSALSRKVAEQAFTAIAPELTPSALQSMLDVLTQKENTMGQNALFDQNEADGEDGVVEGADDSDVEELDEISTGSDEDSDDPAIDPASDESSTSEDMSKDDEEEMQRLDASLGEILKTGRPGADEEATDDESMDDEQMMALEPHLTKIFQERKKATTKKQDNKVAKETVIHFKNRIIDLLTIYIKQQHSNSLALDLIIPLLQLISETTSKQLSDKAFTLLKHYTELCGKKKGLPTLGDTENVWTIFDTVLQEAGRNNSKLYQTACSRASLFLVKVLCHAEQSSGEKKPQRALARAQDMFSGLQKQWMMDPKLEIQLSFFQNWLGWCNDMRKNN